MKTFYFVRQNKYLFSSCYVFLLCVQQESLNLSMVLVLYYMNLIKIVQ